MTGSVVIAAVVVSVTVSVTLSVVTVEDEVSGKAVVSETDVETGSAEVVIVVVAAEVVSLTKTVVIAAVV